MQIQRIKKVKKLRKDTPLEKKRRVSPQDTLRCNGVNNVFDGEKGGKIRGFWGKFRLLPDFFA